MVLLRRAAIPLAERSRVNSSTAAVMVSGGSAGFDRSNAARKRETNTTSPFVSIRIHKAGL
jgi:hypothetical protein